MTMYIDQEDGCIPAGNCNIKYSSYAGKWQDMLMQLYMPSIQQEDKLLSGAPLWNQCRSPRGLLLSEFDCV